MNTSMLKRYFWFILGIFGVIFFWVGIWDGVGSLPYIKKWWISLIIGLLMFAGSGIFLKENNPFGGAYNPLLKVLHKINQHPEKHLFQIKYFDRLKGRETILEGKLLHHLEKDFIVFLDGERERFLPAHRVIEVLHKGKTHWKQ